MIYATYSEGFRRGGGNAARSTSVFGPGQPYNEYKSDTMKNFEVGAKTTWADGRFRLNATAYHMIWEDIQLQANDPNIFTLGIVNFPEAELNGVEANVDWLAGNGWEVGGTLGWNDAEISKTATLFEGFANETTVTKGTRLPIMPDLKGSLSIQYTFQQQLLNGEPYLRLDHTYNGEGNSSLEGIQSIIFTNPVRTLPSYNLTNLRFGIDSESWSAALYIDNVADERTTQFFNDRWAQTRRSINRPRTIGLAFRKSFE
jgi:outer membrane receptor protein involved in Fe transport